MHSDNIPGSDNPLSWGSYIPNLYHFEPVPMLASLGPRWFGGQASGCSVAAGRWATSSRCEAGVRPVGGGDGRAVLLRRGLVEHGEQLGGLVGQGFQVDDSISAIPEAKLMNKDLKILGLPIIGVQNEVSMEISSVQSWKGQPIAWESDCNSKLELRIVGS